MQIVGLAGVSLGGVSRRKDGGAQARSIYQMGFDYSDGVPRPKVRGGTSTEHKKHWLMLPAGVPPSVWTRAEIWRAAEEAERRSDAREGRFFDVSWPRSLPTEDMGAAVARLYQPFVEMGLAVQVDWERSIASDSLFNDHLHGLISTRVVTSDGFAPRKCREVDAWFRRDVRSRVAEVLNDIAETRGVDVRFDHRPNVQREHALPPEVRRSGRAIRGQSPSGTKAQARRDQQRQLRREYEESAEESASLKQRAVKCRAEIDAALNAMTVLTSLQGNSTQALSPETAIATLVKAGLEVTDWLDADGLGLLVVVGESTIIDAGTRMLVDGPLSDAATTALLQLARRKGWRDLSLRDEIGMPLPLPALRAVTAIAPRAVGKRSERPIRSDAAAAARWVAGRLLAGEGEGRDLLNRVARADNPALKRLTAKLAAAAPLGDLSTLDAEAVGNLVEQSLGDQVSLWDRFRLATDLESMMVPGHPLSRPFTPHPRFFEYYGVGGSEGLDVLRQEQ